MCHRCYHKPTGVREAENKLSEQPLPPISTLVFPGCTLILTWCVDGGRISGETEAQVSLGGTLAWRLQHECPHSLDRHRGCVQLHPPLILHEGKGL